MFLNEWDIIHYFADAFVEVLISVISRFGRFSLTVLLGVSYWLVGLPDFCFGEQLCIVTNLYLL
jgi:hypothetical protein